MIYRYLLILIILVLIAIIFCIYQQKQQYLLSPINTILRYDSSPRFDFYPNELINTVFPQALVLENSFLDIKKEGWNLYHQKKGINYLNSYNIDIGSATTDNWTTIPLKLFGVYSPQNLDKCPCMKSILNLYPNIQSCLFSIMEPYKIIDPHYGPYDGLIRYQLPLDIPNCKDNEECYLHVNGKKHYWENGKSILFDETNLHGAINSTPSKRMVLLIDIKRPYANIFLSTVNDIILTLFSLLPSTLSASLL